MADLSYIQRDGETQIVGQDSSGNQVNYVSADVNGNMSVKDYADGPVTAGTAAPVATLIAGFYGSVLPTLGSGQQVALQLDSSGRVLISPTTQGSLAEDHNYGTVGTNTLRAAAQIGNATGAADFAAGNSSAQTLRVVIASNQVAIPVTGTFWQTTQPVSGTFWQTTQPVSGTVAVTQSTSPWVTDGNLTNNNAAPAANNVGALTALAEGTLSASRYTTGNLVLPVVDLAGNTNVDLQYYLGVAVSKTNPIATTISDGTNVITAAISAYGTAPTGTEVMGVNAFITNTPTVNQGTSPWLTKDSADGPVTAGTVASFSQLIGGQYNSTLPTLTTGQQVALQVDTSGRLIISPTALAQGSTTSGQAGSLTLGAVTTNPPAYTTGQTDSLSLTIDGDLRVADIVNTSGQYGAQSVTTTAAEALGAATILANRKSLTITPTNGTIYWGFSNTVTTTTGSPIFKNQSMSFAIGANLHIYVIAAATTDCRIAEGS